MENKRKVTLLEISMILGKKHKKIMKKFKKLELAKVVGDGETALVALNDIKKMKETLIFEPEQADKIVRMLYPELYLEYLEGLQELHENSTMRVMNNHEASLAKLKRLAETLKRELEKDEKSGE